MKPGKTGHRPYILRILATLASLSFLSGLLFSCALLEKKPAVLWTDSPELLIAAELFNAGQRTYLFETHYSEQPARELEQAIAEKKPLPSLMISRGLRSPRLAEQFRPLDYLFGDGVFSKDSFYPGLLQAGMRGGEQLYLPLSFDLMLILEKKGDPAPQGLAELERSLRKNAISLADIKRRSAPGAGEPPSGKGTMGFSPRWPDEDFLFQWVQLKQANFHEPEGAELKGKDPGGRILAWNGEALAKALEELRSYSAAANGSSVEEDNFLFSYLFAPGYKNVESGRILFSATAAARFFSLPPATRAKFDFHYLMEEDRLAVLEDIRYAAIPRRAKSRAAAEAFLSWYFKPENQETLLEASRSLRLSETSFGIAGGYSSLRVVTESILPRYYDDLENKLPPVDAVVAPKPLPTSWESLYKDVVLPWLRAEAAQVPGSGERESLKVRLDAFLDRNPELR